MLFPGVRGEKDQHGDDLQSSQKHVQGEQGLGKEGVAREIARRADFLQTGANVIDAGQGGGEVGFQAVPSIESRSTVSTNKIK